MTPKIKVGTHIAFSFILENTNEKKEKIRLEYAIYYKKANGSLARKIFKISEKEYLGNSITDIYRKQSFEIITTRKFYWGIHQLSLIINGIECNKKDFELVE